MGLNNRGMFHPLFAYHPRTALEGSHQTLVEVYAPSGGVAEWIPGTGMADNTVALVWRGYARVQPNIDWRARVRNHGNELNATHAVRVQIGIGRNLIGAVLAADGSVITYGAEPIFKKDFVVRVVSSNVTGAENLVGLALVVRNALNNDVPWLHNLLCDTGTK